MKAFGSGEARAAWLSEHEQKYPDHSVFPFEFQVGDSLRLSVQLAVQTLVESMRAAGVDLGGVVTRASGDDGGS